MKMGEEHEEGFLGEGGENGTLSVYGCPCMCAPFYARWRVCMRCLEGSWRIWTLELCALLAVKVSTCQRMRAPFYARWRVCRGRLEASS